jgi:hypothetical protein
MKLSTYENPLTGKSSDLFNVSNLWAQVLGVFVLVIVFIFGQKIADFIFPNVTAPATTSTAKATPNIRIF